MAPCRWLPLAMLAACSATLAAQPARFTLAVVKADGRLVPFAAYDRGHWEHAWPEPAEAFKPMPTLENTPSVWRRRGQPIPKLWFIWPTGRSRPVQASITGIEPGEPGCVEELTLTTNLRPLTPPHAMTTRIAADTRQAMTPIAAVRPADAIWATVTRAIVAKFSSLEAQRALSDRVELPREKPAPAIRIAALYREIQSGASPYYFVAEKNYRTSRSPRDTQCAARTIMTGWLTLTSAGRITVRAPKIFLTECDGESVRTAVPLAAVHISDRVFWVLEEHGYEDVSYVVAEIAPSTIWYPLTISGGGG